MSVIYGDALASDEALTGVVKFWNANRGFGFVTRDDGQGDVFLHVSGYLPFKEEQAQPEQFQRITFKLGAGRDGRPCAVEAR